MKKIVFLFMAASLFTGIKSQEADTLKIEDCLVMASNKSPLRRQKSNAAEILAGKIKNLNSNWFPAVGFNAQATYNSETIDLSDIMGSFPGGASIPSLPLDQYKIWADINQQLYDGGAVKAQKDVEKASYDSDILQTEAELLALRQQVCQVYFNLLLSQKSAEILKVSLNELVERKKILQAGVIHGIVLPENVMAMDAEEIGLHQRLTELQFSSDQLIKVLSVLMDSTIAGNTVVKEPVEPAGSTSGKRPELLLFDSQKDLLAANQKLVASGDMPKFFAFSQVAYGRPGYNMVSADFHPFYTIGAGLKWNFLNYGDTKRQKKILDIRKDMVEIKRENFNNQLDIQLQTEITNLAKYDSLMKQDEQILKLRNAIASTSLTKLNNGVLTSMDYLTDMNAEILANLTYQNHKILKKQAAYNFLLLQGKL